MRERDKTRSVLDPHGPLVRDHFWTADGTVFHGNDECVGCGWGTGRQRVDGGARMHWGIVDGVMFVLSSVIERVRGDSFAAAVRNLPLPQAQQVFVDNMPSEARPIITKEEAGILLRRIRVRSFRSQSRILRRDDLRAASSIFVLAGLLTLPPSLPFSLCGVSFPGYAHIERHRPCHAVPDRRSARQLCWWQAGANGFRNGVSRGGAGGYHNRARGISHGVELDQLVCRSIRGNYGHG